VHNLHEQAGSKGVIHMNGELFKSRCDSCTREPFDDKRTYEPPAALPGASAAAESVPHVCWFGEVPFELDRIFCALDECSVFMAIGTTIHVT
jgi:NAD-dependent deacetylase